MHACVINQYFFIVVTAAWKEPVPGWVENLNGPTGLLVGAGKGVIRTMHCRADYSADIMPVDISMNNIILVAWQRGITKTNDIQVVNVCKSEVRITSFKCNTLLSSMRLYYICMFRKIL